jgi:lipid-A-disaccharide synthase-like uncharacterized protein
MDWLHNVLWFHGKFLGITWNAWKVIGFLGNAVFSARFLVQWYVTEKRKQVVVPPLFWWLSLVGSLTLLAYAMFGDKNPVFILGYAFPWIPYARNLIIHHRHEKLRQTCPDCGVKSPPAANFCGQCGARLAPTTVTAAQRH